MLIIQHSTGTMDLFELDTCSLDQAERDEFVLGWENAGGTMDDIDSDTPWCAPWNWCTRIRIPPYAAESKNLQAMGAAFWAAIKEEVEKV